ncbi:MAG: carbamoyltransferase HypF [Bacteroidales bacterium]|nr:carbamoyltransferase HypF [Bacteroidales bacterium]
MSKVTVQLIVQGLVQGVGFRPFIYRLAQQHSLNGWVQNTNENVRIKLTSEPDKIQAFIDALRPEAPPASRIRDVSVEYLELEEFDGFVILKSDDLSEAVTEISPDIAVCPDCLADMNIPGRRKDYAFVNCTNCGPRFTIVRDLPYDRERTTMKPFRMCPDCDAEYHEITDRRFHAQPTACAVCGPEFELYEKGIRAEKSNKEILESLAAMIDKGSVVAIKGLGGMHLCCDAFNSKAVDTLRILKNRETKPFALMFRDLDAVLPYVYVNETEKESLSSFRRPIVLLRTKPGQFPNNNAPAGNTILSHNTAELFPPLAFGINAGLKLQGVMLPYLPFHYLLFKHLKTNAIVLTSGNFSSEPIIIDNDTALSKFNTRVDAILLHNRDIYNRTDDSVVKIMGGRERVLRRSRGFVPEPVSFNKNLDGIIAFGAELSNCFAVGKGNKAFLSQHIGDLKGLETLEFYEQTVHQFIDLFRVKPELLAVDLHPDYASTRLASKFPGLPLVQVQHHHAHIASCMAEHNLDQAVIGVSLDGTGLGTDGNIWGGEIMLCTLDNFTRLTHLNYVPLPGGDLANEEPWRMGISYLYKIMGRDFLELDLPFLKNLDEFKADGVLSMIANNINCPLTSGTGRLFDAVASVLGICQVAAFPAQGPMLLEALVSPEVFPVPGQPNNLQGQFDVYPCRTDSVIHAEDLIAGVVSDLLAGKPVSFIATKFHSSFISVIFENVKSFCEKEQIREVVLSGGVFQNKYVLEGLTYLLEINHFNVYTQESVPSNDGGIALGQMAVAAKRRELGCV